MDLVFLIIGFIALIVLVYLFYTLATSSNPLRTNLDRYALSLTLVRQRFTGLGWVGVVLLFLSPLATAVIVSANLRAIARATFFDTPIPDFTWLYLAFGFLGLIGFVFIIIGREFYAFTPVNQTVQPLPENPRAPAAKPAPEPAPYQPIPEAEPVPRPQFVTTMKDDIPSTTKL